MRTKGKATTSGGLSFFFGFHTTFGLVRCDEAVAVVLGLRQTNFYKSMTTHADHRIWQDVYHAELKSGFKAYIKLTLRENGSVVIQFKEK